MRINYKEPDYNFLSFGFQIGDLKVDEINTPMEIEGLSYVRLSYNLRNNKISRGYSRSIFKIAKNNIDTDNYNIKEEPIIRAIKKRLYRFKEKEIKLFSKTVKIKAWDSYNEDGDLINPYFNDTLLFSDLRISNKGEIF